MEKKTSSLVASVVAETLKSLSSDKDREPSSTNVQSVSDSASAVRDIDRSDAVTPDSAANIRDHDISGIQGPSHNLEHPAASTATAADVTVSDHLGATSAILGNLPDNDRLLNQNLPLGFNVSDKMRSKIFNNEFVDFSSLIFPIDENDTHFNITMRGNGGLGLTAHTKNKKIYHVGQWSQAYDIFVSIHTTKFPQDIQGLLKYGHTIRLLNDTYGFYAAQYYDENFRKLRRIQPIQWDTVHNELWRLASLRASNNNQSNNVNYKNRSKAQDNKHSNFKSSQPFSNNPFRKGDHRSKLPRGFCWSYCSEGKCQQPLICKYKHE
ncbi:uncharacterized protein [Argopecten irradians]|uniref:uncharacterized protein n=1 Tax=Argopecten irradians TaxID=31199 RepID=UPI00371F4F8E